MALDGDFGSRLKRYAQVSSTVGGLMAKIAGERYLGIAIDREGHSENLKQSLGHLKGPLMKVAQVLATVPDMLPPEYSKALLELQSNAPPMGWLFVKRRMRAELGADWESLFQDFSREAVAAASLGQVHKAHDLEGRALACKLQYPDMTSAVEADLQQFKFILSLYEKTSGALMTENLFEEVQARLFEELDYLNEARNATLFKRILQDQPWVRVPEIRNSLTTPRLLTMEWLEGTPLMDKRDAPLEERNRLASHMFHLWYTPFYHYGVIHGDPHMGNYTVHMDGHINLLDFGCIRIFTPEFVQGVITLYRGLQANDKAQIVDAFETWGFQGLTHAHIDILVLWAQYLYGPLLDDRIRPIDAEFSGHAGKAIAGHMFAELRKIGGVMPPREFVFMDRAAVILGSVFMHLRAELNWHQMFEGLIENVATDQIKGNQELILESFGKN